MKKLSNVKSGGILIAYRLNLETHLTVLNTDCNVVKWIKLDKDVLGYENYLVIGAVYISPLEPRHTSDMMILMCYKETL